MNRSRGFTLIEAVVGMLIASLVLAAAYGVWRTHQTEGMRLSKKIELRNKLTLAAKRLQCSVTLAGLGLSGAANLDKRDGAGSDTLVVYTNPAEASTRLIAGADHHVAAVQVEVSGLFLPGGYVAVAGGGHAEIRRVIHVTGSTLSLDSPFSNDYPADSALAYPAQRERFYSRQDSARFVRETQWGKQIVASDVKDFRVSFIDKLGRPTSVPAQARTVRFSLTGVFPARAGAENNIVLSSTAIPRNTL